MKLLPQKRENYKAFEKEQINPDLDFEELFLTIHSKPAHQRHGWPGEYLIRLQPSDNGIASILEVDNQIIHPRYNGYYLLAFDPKNGEQTDFFYIGRDGVHTNIWPNYHYPVYMVSENQ